MTSLLKWCIRLPETLPEVAKQLTFQTLINESIRLYKDYQQFYEKDPFDEDTRTFPQIRPTVG